MRTGSRRALPIRRWLALALASVFLVPVMVTAAIVFHVSGGLTNPGTEAAQQIRAGVARWQEPAWQAAMRAKYVPQGVDFVLVENGRQIYATTPDPLAVTGARGDTRNAQEIKIPRDNGEAVAYVYDAIRQGPPIARPWLIPLIWFGTLLLTIGAIAWFLGRTVVRPLAAASHAARQIATGDLDVALPSSRVREVAELDAAFETMSAELRTSLHHQAELEQERRFFIGAIVHDLRTPLFSLRGYLEGLQKGLADTPEKRERYIAVAQEKAAALERLIADLFSYTRLEYLEQTPQPEPLDLAALLQRLVGGLQPQADAKEIALTLDAPAPCAVAGDPHLLTRAVENLLDNALRYTPSGGNVRVACRAAPDHVTFTVADTGPGIPPHDLPHLFQPLYRGEASRNRRTGGAGLGLTTARRILLAHGGDLTAQNGPAGGAVFAGTLPVSARAAVVDAAERELTGQPL